MKKIFTLLLATAFLFQSCGNGTEKKTTENRQLQQSGTSDKIYPSKFDDSAENKNTDEIILGEDMEEINSYVKDIYKKNGIIYIDLDFVEIKYENIDERVVVNKNPKIRTYIVDLYTEILSKDCKELNALDMLKHKDSLLKDKITVVIGKAKDGKMLSINFGCYG
jgi:hypothetical protein